MAAKHRATGRPRGRPPKIPFDLSSRIIASLQRRVEPETGLVKPDWMGLAREFGVSRSSIAREMTYLRASGIVESVYIPITPKTTIVKYRLHPERQ